MDFEEELPTGHAEDASKLHLKIGTKKWLRAAL